MNKKILDFIKSLYGNSKYISLHNPVFLGNEKQYLNDCIDSTFVSYVGKYVTEFEEITAKYTGANYAIALVNGTAALQIALQIAGVGKDDEVITQPVTFVATANAISHCGAKPVFIDIDLDTMGMSPEKLLHFIKQNCEKKNDFCLNKTSGKKIKAIVPMHTFGHPCHIDQITSIADDYNIPVIEDAAESLGSFHNGKHTGTFGLAGVFSYNGNKTITTGGGGMIITNNEFFAERAKHLTTTGKVPHKYEYIHDEIAYNYRLPNVNAAIGVAQMEKIYILLENKRETALKYQNFFKDTKVKFFNEPKNTKSSFWLNTILFNCKQERDEFLNESNDNGVMTRPIWRLIHKLNMYKNCQTDRLENAIWLEERAVNIPSGYRG